MKRLGGKINLARQTPLLKGVTNKVLRVLGMTFLKIAVGESRKVCKRWIPVVPDSYLSEELLLGCDVLNTADLTWRARENILEWGGASYLVNFVRKRQKVKRVKVCSREIEAMSRETEETLLRLSSTQHLEPKRTSFVEVKVNEKPGGEVCVTPHGSSNVSFPPFVGVVATNGCIRVPLTNSANVKQTYRPGTLLGHLEKVTVVESKVCNTTGIQNDLMPHLDQIPEPEDREGKLRELVETLDWKLFSHEQQEKLRGIIAENESLFILSKNELGKFRLPPAKIAIDDPRPVKGPRYRYPEGAKKEIATLLREMEENGVIEPSSAAWMSPIVLVRKPGGGTRMCLDYRAVNQHLAADLYPLPRLDELVEAAAGHEYYVTLDLKDAYFQVTLHENSRDLTTFSDGVSLYRFQRLPFGLSCAPAIFSRQIEQILAPLIRQGWVRNYLDDIICFAPSFECLLTRLSTLFERLTSFGVKLNLSKCKLAQTEVKFLGHIVSAEGARPDPENVEAIVKTKPPTKVKEVRRFLGMCGFYRKHIPKFAQIAIPLTNLTRSNEEYRWSNECQAAFESLKAKLVEAPVLKRANLEKPFFLSTDASNTHVGGVLNQEQSDGTIAAIGYFSRKLKGPEIRYSTTDKEALAVVLSCRHFQHYLWNRKFFIYTDHQPLSYVFKRKTKSPRMNRWILEMREYQFEVSYVKGTQNRVADFLSRPINRIQVVQEDTILGKSVEEFRNLQMGEERWRVLIEYLKGGPLPKKGYPRATLSQFTLYDDLLYYVTTLKTGAVLFNLVIPHILRKDALSSAHVQSGHLGQKKTLTRAQRLFYWPNMLSDVKTYVNSCPVCQQLKPGPPLQRLYQELPVVNRPLQRVGMDITDMTAGQNNYRYILTIIDHYSRYTKFYPLTTRNTDRVLQCLQQYVADFGQPQHLVLDNAGEFRANAFKEFCRQQHISCHYTTPYHPEGNSITERQHRNLKSVLAALCRGKPLRWPTLLPQCQTILNSAVHTTIAEQPYFAFYRRPAPRYVGIELPEITGTAEEEEEAMKVIKEHQAKMVRKYRAVANRGRKNEAVSENAMVWVKSETPVPATCRKLNLRWQGPYKVVQVLRDGGAYILRHMFNGQVIQRAADKIKKYRAQGEWVFGPQAMDEPPPEPEVVPARERRPPRRYISEC